MSKQTASSSGRSTVLASKIREDIYRSIRVKQSAIFFFIGACGMSLFGLFLQRVLTTISNCNIASQTGLDRKYLSALSFIVGNGDVKEPYFNFCQEKVMPFSKER